MNIFLLDKDINKCVSQYHNKHVVKMVLETAQLLCSAHDPGVAPYKRTHYNHPCAVWTRASVHNYLWLCDLGKAIAKEYTKRYGRRHKSEDVIDWCEEHIPYLPNQGLTELPQCMPDEFKVEGDPIEAYNAYYEHKLYSWRVK
jgi:hypothetical protein